jgi:hypothetical protein
MAKRLSPNGFIVGTHFQFFYYEDINIKNPIRKVRRNIVIPVIPKKAKNLNFYILFTKVNGIKNIANINTTKYSD